MLTQITVVQIAKLNQTYAEHIFMWPLSFDWNGPAHPILVDIAKCRVLCLCEMSHVNGLMHWPTIRISHGVLDVFFPQAAKPWGSAMRDSKKESLVESWIIPGSIISCKQGRTKQNMQKHVQLFPGSLSFNAGCLRSSFLNIDAEIFLNEPRRM